jgi:Fic family protein
MVRVAKRAVRGKTYFYLEHTVREKGKRKTRSVYLGSRLPADLDEEKRRFVSELDQARWFGDFERIRQNYRAEQKATPGSAHEKGLREFSVRFTYDTQRIEGSTLTLRETARLLEERISPGEKPISEVLEAESHHKVFLEMLRTKGDLSPRLVLDWHWKLFKDTKADIAGKVRRHGVRIAGSRFVPPSPVELQALLTEFFAWYRKVAPTLNPVALAALVHLKFVSMHPFADGNGRISRLMMNFVLYRHGFPMLNIEYRGRAAYYRSLERSQLGGDERPFLNWFFRRYERENKPYRK